ncbi:phosphatase PAP2 family protein [Bradyrhizobium australiense]|uniref:Phosphatase PAP2 family protein n=1 Tax=Bradyrhizobium australiense TaxID=2721161 RepID=A0A7Y4GX00_9BRAD|nr:phosphatase PAP2 family protein [Bradyrhizobium australiense]NOJ42912.1 phosphatase PAP2 family protein [Bradyrhizobium australiense]
MALFRVRPTQADIEIADAISRNTNAKAETAAQIVSWGADEHILCALAAGFWLYCRSGSRRARRDSSHVLLTTIAVTLLPHVLKTIFDQKRPDRQTILGHLHGVPFSGKPLDAFPSGHAVHVGALASAASVLPPRKRNLAWSIGTGLVLARIVLLAHWTSDVVAGLAIGVATERLLRRWTGFGLPGEAPPTAAVSHPKESHPNALHPKAPAGAGQFAPQPARPAPRPRSL